MKATRREMNRADAWVEKHLRGDECPFSFLYGGRPSGELLPNWDGDVSVADSNGSQQQTVLTFRDPMTGLQARCVATTYIDFPAVEWVVYLKNTTEQDTSIISDIQPVDVAWPLPETEACRLHHANGSDCKIDDFQPLETPVAPSEEVRLDAHLGRSFNRTLPFFNLQMGADGVIGAIGWTGGWGATFQRSDADVQLRAGMHRTHLKLHPVEEIRTPRILLLFWDDDRFHGHNMLRQFVLAHHTPRPDGEVLEAPISIGIWGKLLAEEQIAQARWWVEHDMPVDYMWVDAGWYGDAPFDVDAPPNTGDWYRQAGNWFPNKNTHPNGFAPVGDAAKEMGLGFVLWIEPERASEGTAIVREHPEWVLVLDHVISYLCLVLLIRLV